MRGGLFRGAGFAEASHVALLFLSLGAPASLLCAAPLFGFAAEKCASLSLSCTELERLGTVTALYPKEDVLLQETPSLDDLYTVTGNKPALLATAAALACGTADPHAEALADAAASLGLRLPRSTAVRCTADGFCGTVHRRTWCFSADSRSVSERIRRTDFGDRQMLYAFSDGNFRGVLLFARQTCPDADAAMRRLHDAGLALPNFEDERRASTAFFAAATRKSLACGAGWWYNKADGCGRCPDHACRMNTDCACIGNSARAACDGGASCGCRSDCGGNPILSACFCRRVCSIPCDGACRCGGGTVGGDGIRPARNVVCAVYAAA